MIICHQHRYLFVELQHTGSTAISRELRKSYGGEQILHKHALYSDFQRIAAPEEREYFVFSAIRNPLDEAVTKFWRFKAQSQKNAHYSKGSKAISLRRDTRGFIRKTDADFPSFLRYHYRLPYNNFSSLAHHQFDFIMRFENLQEDFVKVLREVGLEPIRPLPIRNATAGRKQDFQAYYSPEIRRRAVEIFGPFMHQWGYEFPESWGNVQVSQWAWQKFRLVNPIRNLYWKYLSQKQ